MNYLGSTVHIKLRTDDTKNGQTEECLKKWHDASQKTSRSEEVSPSKNVLLMAPSQVPKKGALCWPYETWKRHQNHGNYGQKLSSSRHPCIECFSKRSHLGGRNACTEIYERNSTTTHWRQSV